MEKETIYPLFTGPVDNGYKLQINQQPKPFNINFYWKEKTVQITLQNGEDIFKIAEAFKILLDEIEVPYIQTEKTNNQL